MADIQQQLRALLKRDVPQLRKTNDEPSRISAIDVVRAVSGKGANEAAEAWRRLVEQYPEVKAKSFDFKFPGRGQRNTPVLCVRGAIELILVLPGHHAAHVRRRASELMVRYLGGPPQANLARRF